MNKGLIITIKKTFAIVLTNTNVYHRIKIKNNMSVGHKIYFTADDILTKKTEATTVKKSFLAVAAVACLIAIMIIGPFTLPQPYALVSIDINPSVDLKIDVDQNVIEIIPINEDAKSIISDEMIGKNILIVMDEIIKNAESQNYLTEENNNILVSSALLGSGNDDLSIMIEKYLSDNLELTTNVRVIYVQSDEKTAKEAVKNGVSLGKLELSKLTNNEKTQTQTVAEIVNDDSITEAIEEKVIMNKKNLLNQLNTLVSQLMLIENPDEDVSEFLASLDFNNTDLFSKYLKEGHELLSEEQHSMLASLNEYALKLKQLPDSETEIHQFLNGLDAQLADPNTNMVALRNQAKSYWNQVKNQYEIDIDDNDDDGNENDEKDHENNGKDEIVELVKLLEILEPIKGDHPEVDSFIVLSNELIKLQDSDIDELIDMAENFIELYDVDKNGNSNQNNNKNKEKNNTDNDDKNINDSDDNDDADDVDDDAEDVDDDDDHDSDDNDDDDDDDDDGSGKHRGDN